MGAGGVGPAPFGVEEACQSLSGSRRDSSVVPADKVCFDLNGFPFGGPVCCEGEVKIISLPDSALAAEFEFWLRSLEVRGCVISFCDVALPCLVESVC